MSLREGDVRSTDSDLADKRGAGTLSPLKQQTRRHKMRSAVLRLSVCAVRAAPGELSPRSGAVPAQGLGEMSSPRGKS